MANREITLGVRVNTAENSVLCAAAERAGLPVSSYLRAVTIAAARREVRDLERENVERVTAGAE